jgi:anti-sigma B factor antagonist
MSENPAFGVTVEFVTEEQAVVSVAGDLDLLGATKLHRPLMDALERPAVVLDMSNCRFCDSSGLRTVLEAVRRADAAGTSFRVAGVGTSVVRVFELAGLLTELTLFPDVETALKG